MRARESVRSLWWLIHKDLTRELRAQNAWPGMLLLGLVLVFLLATQIDLPLEQKTRTVGGLLWLSIFFAGTLALERSFANERDTGCWQALNLYPVDSSLLFLAKMVVNIISLVILEIVLIPAFIVLTDVPLLARPGPHALDCGTGEHLLCVDRHALERPDGRSAISRRHARIIAAAVGDAGRIGGSRSNPYRACRRGRSTTVAVGSAAGRFCRRVHHCGRVVIRVRHGGVSL